MPETMEFLPSLNYDAKEIADYLRRLADDHAQGLRYPQRDVSEGEPWTILNS